MRPLGRVRAAAGYGHAVLTLTGLWTWDCPQAAHHAPGKILTWNTGVRSALPGALRSVTGPSCGVHHGCNMRVRNALTWNMHLLRDRIWGATLELAELDTSTSGKIFPCITCALLLSTGWTW